MQTFYISNSQLISDMLNCFGLIYWVGRLWRQRRPIGAPKALLYRYLAKIERHCYLWWKRRLN